jgi:hypothetical protein
MRSIALIVHPAGRAGELFDAPAAAASDVFAAPPPAGFPAMLGVDNRSRRRHVEADRTRSTADLSSEERKQLRRAHERLRAASQELEGLVATEAVRGRWEPEPPPSEILDASRADLRRAYEELARCHDEILGASSH